MSEPQTRASAPDASVLLEIERAVAASDFSRASRLADAELAAGRAHPSLYSARAMAEEREHEDAKALADYRRALLLSPKNVALLNAIGLCLMRLTRLEESIQAFDDAIRAHPAHAPSHVRRGTALRQTGNGAAAKFSYERALKLDPRNAEALACLASMAAQAGDAKTGRNLAERALALDPGRKTASAALVLADIQEGQYVSAEQRARSILRDRDVSGRASVLGMLGDALDGQDRTEEAFAAYSAENMERLRANAVRFAGKTSVADLSASIAGFVERSPDLSWRGESSARLRDGAPACHVFLLGFFRSGTTLLEQALEAHPEIVTLEERDFLEEPAERYLANAAGLGHLAVLPDLALDALREDYWRCIARAGLNVEGKVFVDKHPLNTLKLLLISKMFPQAKILFAIRDPRDVVLSCFRRHFRVNSAMYDLLTLHGAAQSYDSVMRLAARLRGIVSNAALDHRYEDLVNGFEAAMDRVCKFLGVEFDASMKDFGAVVRRDDIRSPSAAQVRRGLYRESIGQWRRYGAQLEPVLPILRPWIGHFGYDAD